MVVEKQWPINHRNRVIVSRDHVNREWGLDGEPVIHKQTKGNYNAEEQERDSKKIKNETNYSIKVGGSLFLP